MNAPLKRARSPSRLHTNSQAYVPSDLIQLPGVAKAADRRGYGWGPHLLLQRAGMVILAVQQGKHAVSEMLTYIEQTDPKLSCSSTPLRNICKSMALTGVLVPWVEAIGQARMRYMFFLPWAQPDHPHDEKWDHLLTLEEANGRVSNPETASTKRWIE